MQSNGDQQLLKKIADLRNSGSSDEQIIESLTGTGWDARDIERIVVLPRPVKPGAPIINVRGVSKKYKKVTALDDVSLEINASGVTALLGPNGAGKTTLVRILATLLPVTNGNVTVAGLDLVRDAQKIRELIGLAGQYAAVDEYLTARENLEMVARLYHLTSAVAKTRATELIKLFDLSEAADRTLKTYSGGMRRRLDLAASIVAHPKILFLDEPTTGLDPRGRFAMWNIIRDLVDEGTTVVLTTQYLEEADQLADKVFVIDHGRIIAQGTPDELKHKVGGDILEIHLTQHSDAEQAAALIKKFGDGEPHVDASTGIVTIAASGGAAVLVNVVRELDGAKLKLTDVMLRRPSLDDVFLKLTGHEAK